MELIHAAKQLGHPRLLVVGDIMLDRYVWGDVRRVSQEAPILILGADQQEDRLGGAANVAHMLQTLEAHVSLVGVVGNDPDATLLRDLLRARGLHTEGIFAAGDRRTTVKQRFVGRASGKHSGQVLRVDYESRHPLTADQEAQLTERILQQLPGQDAVLISDYDKGVCTPQVVQAVLAEAKQRGIPVLIDPAREGDYARYRGATLLKPNRYEASHATGIHIAEIRDAQNAARQLHETLDVEHIVITLDRDGMLACRRGTVPQHVPSQVRDVYDITGAGDMSFAVLGLGFASGIDLCRSVALANVASGWEVQHEGVVVMTRDDLMTELHGQKKVCKTLELGQLSREISRHKQQGKQIVFTNGCFDLLHVGHVTYLQEAARLGDILVVAVNGDDSVRRLKGPTRPVIGESDRAAMLAALACVDYVIVFHEDTPCHLLETLQPDVLVKGGTYRPEEVVGHEIVTAYGGQIVLASVVDGVSTTRILASLNKAA